MSEILVDPADFTEAAIAALAPACPYCGQPAELVRGSIVYPHREDLADGWYWYCGKDLAWTALNMRTFKPKGRLANAELRRARQDATAAFDPLWQKRARLSGLDEMKARGKGLKWLAEQLGLEKKTCSIGELDVDQCRRVVEICRRT